MVAQDAGSDRAHPKAFAPHSVITTKIKSKLAAEHLATLAHIRVETDENGVVRLRGSAHDQEAVDRAVSIARDTEGVKDVKSTIKIRYDD